MACEQGDLQNPLIPPLPAPKLNTQFNVEESWFQGCGHTNVSCKVIKGKLVEVGKWPWQVSILYLGIYICSGSLIHHQWILTAANCLQRSKDPNQYSVKVGVQQLPENSTQLSIIHIVIHEDFNNSMSQDIALLKLRDPVSWSILVQPICLPKKDFKLPIGSTCWAIGWGSTGKNILKFPYSLQEVAVRILHNQACNQKYRFLRSSGQKKFIGKDMLCGGSEWGLDTCQDNSGSSLVCQVNDTWIQLGVVSWSFSCGRRHFPTVYTSTPHFTQWIQKQISDLKFVSRAGPALLAGHILLVSLGSLWLL
ncbi:putative serine protease 46 [Ochotona curzoniae]|uniref:putative serine protease 46 n=1 Tax=Ochotona curzoniae TaxID=130825 RepID=UPI001B34AC7C|nr:putative serine protease 46 [Ochotona curzoniae]